MKPVDEMWEEFAFDNNTEYTRRKMEQWLEMHYPEVTWHVEPNNKTGAVTVTVEFESKEAETFYMLKWS
jgi:hypothetical protein